MITLNSTNTTAVNATTGTATQQFAAIVSKHLCKPVCSQQSIQPVPTIAYSIVSQETIGTTTFVKIQCQGNIAYVPKNACSCNGITQAFQEETMLVFSNPTATNPIPAVTIAQGSTDGYLTDFKCLTAHGYEIATIVQVNATWS